MSKHLIRSADGHLRKSVSGHLVNECGYNITYPFGFNSFCSDAGTKWNSPNETPTAADYAAARADLPGGSDPGGDGIVCGYTWPWTLTQGDNWSHTLSVYGAYDWVDTSDLAEEPSKARLKVTVTNAGGNNWTGEITVQVRYSDAGLPAIPGNLEDYLTWGTLAGTITIGSGEGPKTAYFNVPPEDIDPDGDFYLALVADEQDDPGYPGGDDWYERKLTLQAWLEVKGTLES